MEIKIALYTAAKPCGQIVTFRGRSEKEFYAWVRAKAEALGFIKWNRISTTR